ncbi:hypothetical protein FPZ24_10450 [Sphingomonas panacisoli]|uniref:Uncharacterized protein n=1 Tax=Sphingomonas panacisoli TaxID=1813879 RepID=A0A5B8LI96_9SPHN|nr:hypothetical protein [Sphingomonas panacisoli]QDZ07853.1 hypothetical protein FPZ24_10450 [Sphingomonas panacisoli]
MSTETPNWLDRTTAIGGLLVLVLVVMTVVVASQNRSLQQQVADGQAKLASAQAAGNVNSTLIRMLASAAADNNDAAIKALLTENGITFKSNAKAPDSAAKTDDKSGDAKKDAK